MSTTKRIIVDVRERWISALRVASGKKFLRLDACFANQAGAAAHLRCRDGRVVEQDQTGCLRILRHVARGHRADQVRWMAAAGREQGHRGPAERA